MSAPTDWYGAPGKRLVLLLLGVLTALQAWWLLPVVFIGGPELNDHCLHGSMAALAADRIAAGQNPLDFWVPHVGLGFPVFHHYQHLPHLVVAVLHLLTFRTVEEARLVEACSAALLLAWPWVVFRSLRSMRIGGWSALGAAVVAPVVSSAGAMGIGYESYLWPGFGLFTQLFAMVLLPPAMAALARTMRGEGRWATAAALLAATALCHPVFGLIAAVSAALLTFTVPRGERARALVRWIWIGCLTAAVCSYFLVPLWLDRHAVSQSIWEPATKFMSYGHREAFQQAVSGLWWDGPRVPVVTALVLGGAALTLTGRGGQAGRWGLALLVLWTALFLGRPTWGQLYDLVPLVRSLQLHRLIAGVQLGGLLLAGMALGRLGEAAQRRWSRGGPWGWWPAAAAMAAVLAFPAAHWSYRFLHYHDQQRENRDDAAERVDELEAALTIVDADEPSRLYPGRASTWGGQFRIGYTPIHLWLTAHGRDNIAFLAHSLSPAGDSMILFDDGRRGHYRLFNVRYTLSPPDLTPPLTGVELQRTEHQRLTATPGGGYFDLIWVDHTVRGDPDYLASVSRGWMGDAGPETGEHLALVVEEQEPFTEMAPVPRVSAGRARPGGKITGDTWEPGHAEATVDLPAATVVMLKTTYHPGWQATIDGEPAETLQVTPGFVAVEVEPGTHQVVFHYRPHPVKLPLALAALALLGVVALVERRHRARAQPPLAAVVDLPAGVLGLGWDVVTTRRWATRLRPHLPQLALIALVVLLAGLPLLKLALPSGHDTLQYIPRLVEFDRNVRAGHLLPAWAPDLAGGRGLPLFLYTPPLFVGTAQGFLLLTDHPVTALNLALLTVLLGMGLATYLWARRWFGPWGATAAASGMVLAPYTLTVLYVRGAYDELTSLAVVPLVLWGIDRAVDRPALRSVGVLALCAALLGLGDSSILAALVPLVLAYAVGRVAASTRGGRRRAALVTAGGLLLGAGVAAWALYPDLALRHLVHWERVQASSAGFADHFVEPFQWFRVRWGWGASVKGPADGMSFGVGAVHLIAAAGAGLLLARGASGDRLPRGLVWGALLTATLALVLTSAQSTLLWSNLPWLREVTFPWRFLGPAALATSALIGAVVHHTVAGRPLPTARGLVLAVLAALLLLSLPLARPHSLWPIYPSNWSIDAIAGGVRGATWRGELQPTWARGPVQAAAATPAGLPPADGQLQRFERPGLLEMEAEVTARRDTELVFGTFYFPGWRAWIDGARVEPKPEPGSGLIAVAVPTGSHEVRLRFGLTPGQRITRIGSAGCLVAALLLVLWPRRRKPTELLPF